MKLHPKYQKVIVVLLIFIMLTDICACYTQRKVSPYEIAPSIHYVVQYEKSAYITYDLMVSEGTVYGKLDYNFKNNNNRILQHIFLTSDSLLKINNDKINFPVSSVKEIRQRMPDRVKTTFLIVGVGLGIVSIIGIILIIKGLNDIPAISPQIPNSSTQFCSNW